jgi:iron complex outermembrane receptor protein
MLTNKFFKTSLSLLFLFVLQISLFAQKSYQYETISGDPDGNTSNIGIILDGVHEDGTPNTTVVHYYYKYLPNAGGWGKFVSTPGILENTWVKMRELSLAYTIPQKWLEKLKAFQNLTVSFTARDLFYIYTTLPDKINPEGIMGSGNAQGFEWASFPGTRSFVFGLTASF